MRDKPSNSPVDAHYEQTKRMFTVVHIVASGSAYCSRCGLQLQSSTNGITWPEGYLARTDEGTLLPGLTSVNWEARTSDADLTKGEKECRPKAICVICKHTLELAVPAIATCTELNRPVCEQHANWCTKDGHGTSSL